MFSDALGGLSLSLSHKHISTISFEDDGVQRVKNETNKQINNKEKKKGAMGKKKVKRKQEKKETNLLLFI
jgi:hypothetical protein